MPIIPPRKKPSLYFNDINTYSNAWLRNLFDGSIVDGTSISKLNAQSLAQYKRVHLFAGIGGWEYALQLAKFPINEVVWTGSCPCQPFSTSGKQHGTADARHLWPEMYRLIKECTPPTIFGEQVAGQLGLEWLDGVLFDLETLDYAVAATTLPAASVGAPHKRERIFWVAYSNSERQRAVEVQVSGDRESVSNTSRPSTPWGNNYMVGRDGRKRRVEPGICTVAPRIPGQVEQIHAYGNAIVPQVAAVFIKSFLEARSELV